MQQPCVRYVMEKFQSDREGETTALGAVEKRHCHAFEEGEVMNWSDTDERAVARNFAQYLRERRDNAGMTRSELAELIGMSRNTYKNYEQGYTAPSLATLYRLYFILDLDINEFFQNPGLPDTVQLCEHCRGKGYTRKEKS